MAGNTQSMLYYTYVSTQLMSSHLVSSQPCHFNSKRTAGIEVISPSLRTTDRHTYLLEYYYYLYLFFRMVSFLFSQSS